MTPSDASHLLSVVAFVGEDLVVGIVAEEGVMQGWILDHDRLKMEPTVCHEYHHLTVRQDRRGAAKGLP
jgi:hypothetical protein